MVPEHQPELVGLTAWLSSRRTRPPAARWIRVEQRAGAPGRVGLKSRRAVVWRHGRPVQAGPSTTVEPDIGVRSAQPLESADSYGCGGPIIRVRSRGAIVWRGPMNRKAIALLLVGLALAGCSGAVSEASGPATNASAQIATPVATTTPVAATTSAAAATPVVTPEPDPSAVETPLRATRLNLRPRKRSRSARPPTSPRTATRI